MSTYMSTYVLIANGKRVRLTAAITDVTYTRSPDGADQNITIDAARADVYVEGEPAPIDMILHCPACGLQHIDAPEVFVPAGPCTCRGPDQCDVCYHNQRDYEEWKSADPWTNPPHRSHLCHGCGFVWRPADVPTNGVESITTKGKNDSPAMGVHIETEEQGYAIEATWQFVPELKPREDNLIVLTPAQLETILRRLGWRAPCDERKGRT